MKRRDVGAEKSSWLPSITLDDVTFSSMVEKWEREKRVVQIFEPHAIKSTQSIDRCDPI